MQGTTLIKHAGGCHCGAIRFQVDAPAVVKAWDCNCSICAMKGNAHFVVPQNQFTLLKGEDNLSLYQFNTKIAKHYFCKTCGVTSFYIPRSNPDGYGITVACVDPGTIQGVEFLPCDGKKWEQFVESQKEKIAAMSRAA